MKQKTLLDLAKEASKTKLFKLNLTDEDSELAMAWVNNEISLSQIQKAKGIKPGNTVYSYLSMALRNALNKK